MRLVKRSTGQRNSQVFPRKWKNNLRFSELGSVHRTLFMFQVLQSTGLDISSVYCVLFVSI